MGKREKKTGKGRLDKFYHLAKEQGYRARSAFKLVQINAKYDFLRNSKCVIDLCAAPGGWLQVCAKNMPPNSLIIGVDLAPIKPIPHVVTFVEDITTEKCRQTLRAEMKDWKADVVLHDGAPNVGSAWNQDAFTQVELVLASMKLATEFLAKGGTFCTKVFRSKDYNSLMWVFNQLFTKVEATKPASSRNVSAEIFVVCQGYLAPKKLDPKFLNPKYVFQDLNPDLEAGAKRDTALGRALDPNAETKHTKNVLTPASLNVFKPEKKRRQREGYDDLNLYKECSVLEFVQSGDPIGVLSLVNRLNWNDVSKEIRKHPATTPEIKTLCEDIKVLGKGEFKSLLKYRVAIREFLGLEGGDEEEEDGAAKEPAEDNLSAEEKLRLELDRLARAEEARKHRARKRANEKKNHEVQKMQLNMVTPMDIGIERQDGIDMSDMFDLGDVQGDARQMRAGIPGGLGSDVEYSGDEDEDAYSAESESESDPDVSDSERKVSRLEAMLDAAYSQYQEQKLERDSQARVKEQRRKRAMEQDAEGGAWGGIGDQSGSESDSTDGEKYEGYGQEKGFDDDTDSSESEGESAPTPAPVSEKSRQAAIWFDQAVFKNVPGLSAVAGGSGAKSESDGEGESDAESDAGSVSSSSSSGLSERGLFDSEDEADDPDLKAEERAEKERLQHIEDLGLTTEEAMTLAQQLVNGERTKSDLLDQGFNRYANQVSNMGDDLPPWFIDDEQRHFRKHIPITKEAVEAVREKMRALNARPIKKIAEAKARKKLRTVRRMEKLKKKMMSTYDDDESGMTEKDKAAQINKLLAKTGAAKSGKVKDKKEVKLVVARGQNRGLKGRPKGVKGRYKMVDPRMKKEMRAMKRIAKRDKKRK